MAQLSLSRSNCTAMGSNMSNLAFSNGEMELISLLNFCWVQKL